MGAVYIGPFALGGEFNQYGGTNYASLSPQNGNYTLFGGSVLGGPIAAGTGGANYGRFLQSSGLVSVTPIRRRSNGPSMEVSRANSRFAMLTFTRP